jgi:hypothetical protein
MTGNTYMISVIIPVVVQQNAILKQRDSRDHDQCCQALRSRDLYGVVESMTAFLIPDDRIWAIRSYISA